MNLNKKTILFIVFTYILFVFGFLCFFHEYENRKYHINTKNILFEASNTVSSLIKGLETFLNNIHKNLLKEKIKGNELHKRLRSYEFFLPESIKNISECNRHSPESIQDKNLLVNSSTSGAKKLCAWVQYDFLSKKILPMLRSEHLTLVISTYGNKEKNIIISHDGDNLTGLTHLSSRKVGIYQFDLYGTKESVIFSFLTNNKLFFFSFLTATAVLILCGLYISVLVESDKRKNEIKTKELNDILNDKNKIIVKLKESWSLYSDFVDDICSPENDSSHGKIQKIDLCQSLCRYRDTVLLWSTVKGASFLIDIPTHQKVDVNADVLKDAIMSVFFSSLIAAQSGDRIHVSFLEDDDYWNIFIRDTGVNISFIFRDIDLSNGKNVGIFANFVVSKLKKFEDTKTLEDVYIETVTGEGCWQNTRIVKIPKKKIENKDNKIVPLRS